MLEVYKDEAWGQANVRVIPAGATVGAHRHPETNERWLFLRADRVLVTLDGWAGMPGPWEPLEVPAGTGHTVTNLGGTDAVLLFWRDRLYDPERPDKEAL
jgi:hypothetical protein